MTITFYDPRSPRWLYVTVFVGILISLYAVTVSSFGVTFSRSHPAGFIDHYFTSKRTQFFSSHRYTQTQYTSSFLLASPSSPTSIFSVSLPKPLGLILSEVNENQPNGVIVSDVTSSGSAYTSPYQKQILGSKLVTVNHRPVDNMMFDDVMQLLVSSESPVSLGFDSKPFDSSETKPVVGREDSIMDKNDPKDDTQSQTKPSKPVLSIGTPIQLTIRQVDDPSVQKVITAKVGDNLRTTLLDNGVELYRGWKKKLGNCGGGGQCTFCAVDLVVEGTELEASDNVTPNSYDESYWEERSEYEEMKIGKKMGRNTRLACLNNIMGPATIVVL